MNAIDFFKSTGLCHVKFLLEDIDKEFIDIHSQVDGSHVQDKVSVSELKQIVDAFELVESLGGMDMAKDIFDIEIHEPHYNYDAEKVTRIEQAINLVEKCL